MAAGAGRGRSRAARQTEARIQDGASGNGSAAAVPSFVSAAAPLLLAVVRALLQTRQRRQT